MERLFTVDEARALLPRARGMVVALRDRKAELDQHHAAYLLLAGRVEGAEGRHDQALARHHGAVTRLAGEIEVMLAGFLALGVEVKGIDQGLLDFRSRRDGRTIYLCWQFDEPDIAFWHELATGFLGRQPLQ